MKFGLFYQLPCATTQDAATRYQETIEQIVYGKELGFDTAWLTGPGLAQLGADERLCAGDYTIAQRWSTAFLHHPQKPDGLYYRSRHDPQRACAALYPRRKRTLRVVRHVGLAERDATWLLGTLQRLYAFLIDDT
jgi:RES domain